MLADAAVFPRDKTCGDGLTPRAIGELQRLGLDDWLRAHTVNQGLRAHGFGQTLLLPWPGGTLPDWGSAVARTELDDHLRTTAIKAGAPRSTASARSTYAATATGSPRWCSARDDETARDRLPPAGRRRRRPLAAGQGARPRVAPRHRVRRGRPVLRHLRDVRRPVDQLPPRAPRRGRRGAVRLRLDLPARHGRGEPRRRHPRHRQAPGRPRGHAADGVTTPSQRARASSGSARSCGRPPRALLPMGGAVTDVAGANWALIGDAAACVNPLNGEGIDYGARDRPPGRRDDRRATPTWPPAWPALLHRPLRRVVLDRPSPGRAGHRPARCSPTLGPGRDALRLADDAGPALDGQPGHRRGPRPRRPGVALGRTPLASPATTGRRSPDRMGASRPRRCVMPKALPKLQRVAAYAVILRDERILLTRLASRISADEQVARCPVAASTTARTRATPWSARSARRPASTPRSATPPASTPPTCPPCGVTAAGGTTRRCGSCTTPGCRPTRPTPRVVEVDGSTVDAAWHPVADVLSGALPVHRDRHRVAGRPPTLPAPAAGGLRAGPPRRGGAAHPDLRARLPPRLVDAARMAASTTASRRVRVWPGRCARSAASTARWATCSTSTTPTSAARLPPAASRTSTGSTWSSGPPSPTTPSRGWSRSTAPPTRSPGYPSPSSTTAVAGARRGARGVGRRSALTRSYTRPVNPRHRRLVIPVALAGLLLIVVIASVVRR